MPQGEVVKILPLYERIARQSGDERLLLDYLERRAATPAITVAEAREAVDLAVALGESARVEPLLLRLAEVGAGASHAGEPEARRDAAWASLELIQRRKSAGDLEGAADALGHALERELIDLERATALTRELADRAGKAGNQGESHRLAATLLERLRVRAPGDESIWRPLLAHYVALQDRAGLERVVGETLPLLPEVGQRNQLRLARARVLLACDERDTTAPEILRDVLLEERRNAEALTLLAGYYERTGAGSDLTDLLEQHFEAACEAGDPKEVAEAALRLGALLESENQERAVALYERALGIARGRRDLLERLIALRGSELTPDYATRMEDLLSAETGPEAAGLAREIAALWSKLGDRAGVRRVLEKGHKLAPADEGIGRELEGVYRDMKSWPLVVGLLMDRAQNESDAGGAVTLLLEAATLLETELSDTAGATALLRTARKRQPGNGDVVERLVRALASRGQIEAALTEASGALGAATASEMEPARRLSLSVMLAELEGARGNHRVAVSALRSVLDLGPDAVSERLGQALEAWRAAAAATGAAVELRAATLELVDRARRHGDVGGRVG